MTGREKETRERIERNGNQLEVKIRQSSEQTKQTKQQTKQTNKQTNKPNQTNGQK